MALVFMDSFDHYGSADITEKWSINNFVAINAGSGRRGTASARISSSSTYLTLQVPNQPTYIVGFAFRPTSMPGSNAQFVELRDGSTTQVGLYFATTGVLFVTRGVTGLQSSTQALTLNIYHYIEIATTIHSTLGTVTVCVNGTPWITATNQNTQQTANAFVNAIRLGAIGSTGFGTTDLDDVYVCDGTGSTNNTLLGDCRVDALLPTADGSNSAWTVSTGTTHSTLVDETAPNDNTDYVSTSTAGARDSYAMADLPAMVNPTIYGIQQLSSLAKDDAGTRQVKNLLKSGATTVVGSTTHTLASSFIYYREVWETNPDTSAAWSVAAVNALEAGVENV